MNSNHGLSQDTVDKIKRVLVSFSEIKKTILYGSRAKGTFKTGSDIDLTLDAPTLTTSQLLSIQGKIDDLLLPYKVDLSILQKIENAELVDHIRRIGKEF